jgi:F0F1-type ATP synthase epsilon subunit
MFKLTIFNLKEGRKDECNATSCSLISEEEGSISILSGHQDLLGTLKSNSIVTINATEASGVNSQKKFNVLTGIFEFKNKELSLYLETRSGV